MLCWSCHQKLHKKIRREDKCPYTPNEIEKFSVKAALAEYRKSEHGIAAMAEYQKFNIEYLHFTKTLMQNVQFHEMIRYNLKTGNVSYSTGFEAINNKKLATKALV